MKGSMLHLRDAIVAGHFDEHEPIRQDDIARPFNVSKIPVREALKRLEAEGLVIFQRNRGAMVTRNGLLPAFRAAVHRAGPPGAGQWPRVDRPCLTHKLALRDT